MFGTGSLKLWVPYEKNDHSAESLARNLGFRLAGRMCGWDHEARYEAAMNSLRLADLEIWMTKDEVIDLMGEPSQTEVYEIQGRNVESWLYLTAYERPYSAPDPKYTPLVFEGDVLKGWGMPYYEQAIKEGSKIEQ